MTLTVGGLTSIHNAAANDNYDTPTNPKITKNSAFTQRVFGIIHTDDTLLGSNANTVIEKVGTALLTEYSNLDNTNGHTIRCYDGTNGVDLASIDLTTDNYFVLIHSDDANMHHFAKIDTVENADSNGDSFTFEPKLGNRVAKGTKFMIFKGPSIANSTKIIAITAGLDASTFGANYVVSRPLWYFYNDKTVKDNELDHNTKYFVRLSEASSGNSIDLSTSAEKVSFVTMAETHYRVIDSSKYSYVVKLKDELKIKDDPDIATSNESSVLTGTFTDYTDYNDCFINARRDSDDNYSALSLNGLTRYTHYRDSPMKSNLLPNVFDSYVEESIDGKAGFSETKIIDNNQVISKKLSINQDYRIRQAIGTGSFNDWIELGEIDSFVLSGSGVFHYSLKNAKYGEPINISEYFEVNEEIKIGNRICIVNDPARNGNNIVIRDYSRLETEGKFTNTTTLNTFTSGTKVYRRAFSKVNSNLLTTVRFEDSMLDKLRIILYSDSANAIEATVVDYQTPSTPHGSVNIDNTYQLLYLNFENNYHDSDDNGLEYAEGDYVILYEVFTGTVEKINKKIEQGNNIVVLSGRNSFSKVVNPIVNKDTLYSLDTIYSSRSPYVSLTSLGTTITTLGFDDKTVNFGSSVTIDAGTEIHTDIGFIGKIDSSGVSSATTGELEDFPAILANAETVYKRAYKQIIFNKAQASNLAITSSTDLSAAADKGLSFREGTVLTSAGAEESDLAGTSSDSDVRAVGYRIDNTDSVGEKDSLFLAKDTIFSSGKETINTMIDFTILSVRKEETNNVVKLAPYVPLTLGRSHPNFKNTSEITFTKVADAKGANNLNGNASSIDVDGVLNNSIPYDTPIYIEDLTTGERVFVGRLDKQIIRGYGGFNSQIKVKRTFPYKSVSWNDNALVQIPSAKNHHELHLTNGAHLHGGKTIALLGPKLNIINFETFDNATYKSYSNKFGHSIFRIFNLEKGKIGAEKSRFSVSNLNTEQTATSPIYNYYATAYKGRNKVNYNKLGSSTSNKLLPIERRGILPAIYSNYARPIFPNFSTTSIKALYYPRLVDYAGNISGDDLEDTLFYPNPNAARLFLFINSDLYPYSSSRTDSLMNSTTRNLSKYGLLSIKELKDTDSSEEKENVKGQTKRQTHLDSSYSHSSIIESNKTLSSLKRFGLMRLTEFMTDFAFNPINPETKINKEGFVRTTGGIYNFDITRVETSGGSICQIVNTSDYSHVSLLRHTITLNNTPSNLSVDDLLVDMDNFVIWGKVTAISGADITANVYHKSDDGDFYTGVVYAIPDSDVSNSLTLTGRFDDAAYFNDSSVFGTSFHPQKALVFGEPSTNGFSDNSAVAGNEFNDKYGQTMVEYGTHNFGTSSPFAFRDDGTSFLNKEITISCTSNGTNVLTVADSSVVSEGAKIITIFSPMSGVPANTFVDATPSSTTIRLNNVVSSSATGNITFRTQPALKYGHLAEFIKQINYANFTGASSTILTTNKYSDLRRYKFTILDNYTVQDEFSSLEGQATKLTEMFFTNIDEAGGDFLNVPINTPSRYAYYKNDGGNTVQTNVAGVYAGYKFFIDTADTIAATSTRKAVGNNQYHAFKLSHLGRYNFLKFVDLTGCYLVPLKGKDSKGNTISRTNNFSGDVHVDSGIAYIVSHNYDTTTSITNEEDYSWIITDIDIDATNEEYVIMQPNPVCMWTQSPKEIYINHLSRKYTKKSNRNEMYEDITDFSYVSGQNNDRTFSKNMANEGIRSMYVIVDSDNITNSGFTVLRTRTEIDKILDNTELELCLSDGEKSILSGSKLSNYGDYSSISLDRNEYFEGVISVSEPFELKVNGDIQEDDKRAFIGSTLDISKDAEDLVEELFKENDITHSLTRSNYSIYTSPDFQGTSLYVLSKYLLNLKDKDLFDSLGTITSRSIDSGSRVSKFEFNDDNIFEYELVDSGFDFYNEIVVYGSSHRAIKKNIRSIKEIGKKTLEIFDKKLKSQIDVDKRAFDLLKIHNNDVSNLNVKTHIRDAETLSSGDIVTVEIKQENIPRNLYVVLEMKYEISGITTLVLGKYIKNIEDRFAEVLLANNQTDSYLRRNDYPSNENTFDFFENLKIKEIQLTIRKRTQTGITLGFSHTLNTNASTIGFGGGTITHTTLLEEDL